MLVDALYPADDPFRPGVIYRLGVFEGLAALAGHRLLLSHRVFLPRGEFKFLVWMTTDNASWVAPTLSHACTFEVF